MNTEVILSQKAILIINKFSFLIYIFFFFNISLKKKQKKKKDYVLQKGHKNILPYLYLLHYLLKIYILCIYLCTFSPFASFLPNSDIRIIIEDKSPNRTLFTVNFIVLGEFKKNLLQCSLTEAVFLNVQF